MARNRFLGKQGVRLGVTSPSQNDLLDECLMTLGCHLRDTRGRESTQSRFSFRSCGALTVTRDSWGCGPINRLRPVTAAIVFGSVGFIQISQHRVTNQENSNGSDKHEDLRTGAQRAKPKNHRSYSR